jgi:hypothetical protein
LPEEVGDPLVKYLTLVKPVEAFIAKQIECDGFRRAVWRVGFSKDGVKQIIHLMINVTFWTKCSGCHMSE